MTLIPLADVLALIEEEPELPGPMPEHLIKETMDLFQDDPSAPLRAAVRATKNALIKKLTDRYK